MFNRQRKWDQIFVFGLFVVSLLMSPFFSVCARAEEKSRGWVPQKYEVRRDEAAGRLILTTPYYRIEHDLKRGGVVSMIRLTHGQTGNLLVSPMETNIQLVDPEPAEAGRGARSRMIFKDINDASAVLEHKTSGLNEIVTVTSSLVNGEGDPSGITVKTEYAYHWGYVKVHKEIKVQDSPVKARNLCVLSTILDPSLSDYGYRPGVREIMDPNLFTWRNGQIRQWGKIRPGTHFDMPFRTRQLPRYLVFANPGVEGFEWFMSDDLWQWDYQMTGTPGTGFCEAQASTDPLGVALDIYPVILSSRYVLPKGGSVEMKGSYVFDYYIGFPILEGHANVPWLAESIRGVRTVEGEDVTEEDIKTWAEAGISIITLHNDGDGFKDGIFWRDGSYPPYPPEIMKRMDEVIDLCHKYGLKIMPYFSNHELHQSTEEFKKYGEEWGRIVDAQGNLRPNTTYGPHMCLKSGWLDYLKLSIDRVLKNHDFDGIYYDWNIAMFCNNPLHVGKTSNGVDGSRGLASPAISPTVHWDIDELIDLVEWTRERVGPKGIAILHNTLVPMFATENFATQVLGMEFSYGRLLTSIPMPNEVPLEWNFAGARPRGVIGYGTVARNAPKRLFRLHAILSLITSVTPWRVNPEAIEIFKLLRPLGDLETYVFEDWRNKVVRLDDTGCSSAVYSRPGEAYIFLANFDAEAKEVRCRFDPGQLAHPLAAAPSCVIIAGGEMKELSLEKLTGEGETVHLPGDGLIRLQIK